MHRRSHRLRCLSARMSSLLAGIVQPSYLHPLHITRHTCRIKHPRAVPQGPLTPPTPERRRHPAMHTTYVPTSRGEPTNTVRAPRTRKCRLEKKVARRVPICSPALPMPPLLQPLCRHPPHHKFTYNPSRLRAIPPRPLGSTQIGRKTGKRRSHGSRRREPERRTGFELRTPRKIGKQRRRRTGNGAERANETRTGPAEKETNRKTRRRQRIGMAGGETNPDLPPLYLCSLRSPHMYKASSMQTTRHRQRLVDTVASLCMLVPVSPQIRRHLLALQISCSGVSLASNQRMSGRLVSLILAETNQPEHLASYHLMYQHEIKCLPGLALTETRHSRAAKNPGCPAANRNNLAGSANGQSIGDMRRESIMETDTRQGLRAVRRSGRSLESDERQVAHTMNHLVKHGQGLCTNLATNHKRLRQLYHSQLGRSIRRWGARGIRKWVMTIGYSTRGF
ncbi:hypothetical protein B0H21DRAFT_4568 [Amylocystis lapponica]|nr:hypothetical protein B0H21DRAFT_4568 [Amylocystis lapponica]